VLEPELEAVTDEILATIAREVPDYARPLEGRFGHGVRTGVTEALRQFVELICARDARSTRCSPPTASEPGWPGVGWPRRRGAPSSIPSC